jgi:hypothetical protein
MQHSHQTIFYSENQTMTFSYTRFPVNKINIEKNFKIMRKSLFNYFCYSHPEIEKFQGVTPWPIKRGGGRPAVGTRNTHAHLIPYDITPLSHPRYRHLPQSSQQGFGGLTSSPALLVAPSTNTPVRITVCTHTLLDVRPHGRNHDNMC